MKKIFWIAALTFIIVAASFLLLNKNNEGIVYKQLSSRAQEFMKEQKKSNNQDWNDLDMVSPGVTKVVNQSTTIANDCFSAVIPFTILKNKNDSSCNTYVTFDNPLGDITLYQQEAPTTSIDQNPAIIMRRSKKNLYNESSISVNGRQYAIFQEESDTFHEVVFSQQGNQLFTLSIESYSNEDLSLKINQIIKSIVYK